MPSNDELAPEGPATGKGGASHARDAARSSTHSARLERASRDFPNVEGLLEDPGLTEGEKRSILLRWEHDARGMDVAEEENMAGGSTSVLGRIRRALLELGEVVERRRDAPTKHGGL
jgi:hypothetical protein